ncbi:L-ribulose-5-phosphate 4-epimerase [Paucisalibacillus globulus]|uniref:L-ribulose-5-phosphate 4-epimerase n=1 Tax=Paucisalibacillus globulus TaxID=351095 RepID=UPI000BB7D0CC|nr:L-ribulose-5-phosphate 4-epimerase [Paucisalibacillus globulus]
MYFELRSEVCQANKKLKENNLVRWTSGNVSYRIPDTELVIIKPSGVDFDDLTPENMVIVNLDGDVVEGDLKPSVDTESHLYVYKHRKNINSVIHTHSPFATSFAIQGKSLPSYTTTAANVFRHGVPCSGFASIGSEEIGKEIVKYVDDCPAILLKNHGVFTVGDSINKALKAAVILEETAEYAHYALLHNPNIEPLPSEVVDMCNNFYATSYGQK